MNLQQLCPQPLPTGFNLTEEVIIEAGAIRELPAWVDRYCRNEVLCVADPQTLQACQQHPAFSSIQTRYSSVFLLPENPHASMELVDTVIEQAGSASGLLALGSGTVNDVCKMASTRLGIPYVVFGTAASMNGYASSIAALLENGLKTTQNATPPRAIVMDIDILMDAPLRLTQAGLGDLLSKSVSSADYWLSDRLENSGFNALPGQLVDAAIDQVTANANGLAHRNRLSYESLAKALVLSGVSMAVAGSSSPASGGEHLISHLWDMQALIDGQEFRLHGAQVGVSTCICAALYHRLLDLEQPAFISPPSWESEEKRIRSEHGKLADLVRSPAQRKHARLHERLALLHEHWGDIRTHLINMKIPQPAEINALLRSIGAPHTLADLAISPENALRTLRLARDIRDRITVLDIAFETGLFPTALHQVLQDSGTLSTS